MSRWLSRLAKIDCCALCDASGKKARVLHGVRPLLPGYKMAGTARTVKLDGDFLTVLLALRDAQPGDVLMIDAGVRSAADLQQWPRNGGMFGELLGMEAQRKGLAGLVIDGNCRDTAALRTLEIPIFSRGCHPNAGNASTIGETQVPVSMCGFDVKPGELVLGDDDGVVVVSEEELAAWADGAEGIQTREAKIFEAVAAGTPLLDLPEIAGLARLLPPANK